MDAPIRVLYAEDDPRDVDLTRSRFALEQPAFEIEIVDTGEKCWTRLQQQTYDILLLDYRLPDMDGIDLLKRLVLGGLTLPAVMVTGLGDEEIVVQALRLGAIDYVPKSDDYLATLPSILKGIALEYRQRKVLAQPLAPPRRRILYIERHQMDIDLTLSHLSEAAPHLAVTVVKSCADALQLLVTDRSFDLVLTDLRMPDMSALDFFRELKHRGMMMPFVIITGQGDEETAVAALKLGATDYIVKRQNYLAHLPYTIEQTIVRFQLDLTNSQLRQEIAERRQAEDALRESEKKLKTLFEVLSVGVSVLDAKRKVIYQNPAVNRILDVSSEDLRTESYKQRTYLRPDGTPMPFEEYASVRATHEQRAVYNVEAGIVKENGNVIWTNVSAVPVDFPDWKVVIVTSDITERKQAEEALRESEERFSRLSAVTVEGIVISEQGKVIDANDQYARLLGYQPGELIGRSIAEMVAPESRDLVMANVRANVPGPYEHLALKKDGSLLPVEIRARSISYKGRTARVTVIRDMSERKQAEQELRASEARFRALIENATDMVRVLDPSGVTVYVSPSTKRIMGYELEEMLGRSAFELVHPNDLARVKERWQRAVQLQASTLGVIEARVRHADGTWHIHEAIGTNLLNDPSVRGFVMNTRDVTERKQHEQALRESEERYRAIFDGVRDAIFVETLSGQILDVNTRACEMFGYSREEFLNKQVTDLVPPDQPAIMPNAPAGQEFLNRSVETVNLRAKGQPFPVEINGRLQTINGETCLLVVVRDITERKRAEETTRSLAKFPAENPSPVVRLDAAGIILYANEASEVLLREWNCTVGDPAPAMWRELCTQALAAQARHTLDYEYSGEVYSFVITPIVDLNYVNLYAINTTVRKQAEEALRRSAQRLEILHHIDRAMLTAQSPEAIAETALLRLRDLIPFQRADVVLFDTDKMLVLATVPLTGTVLRSGLKLPIEPDWIAELQRGEPIVAHDLSAFTSQRFSVQVLEAEGMQSLVNVPLLARGQLIGVLNLAANTLGAFKPEHVDIATEVADQIAVMIQQARLHEQVQRHADELEIRVAERTRELSLANEQLKELDYAKDQFVSNVSHELRVPLANLKLYINLLERGKPEKRAEYMETLHREHGRLDKMIEDLLDLSRLDLGVTQIQPAPTDLNLLLSQLIGDRTALAAEHQLVLDYQPDPDLPMALIDPVVLIEVITNLIGNAVNYTPASGMITVITATREHEGQTWVTFTVQDNGPGISAKDMPHLFERFYRGEVGRKADAPGTGLGLAICKEIVDRLGGHITVESESGQGSTFTVWLKPAN